MCNGESQSWRGAHLGHFYPTPLLPLRNVFLFQRAALLQRGGINLSNPPNLLSQKGNCTRHPVAHDGKLQVEHQETVDCLLYLGFSEWTSRAPWGILFLFPLDVRLVMTLVIKTQNLNRLPVTMAQDVLRGTPIRGFPVIIHGSPSCHLTHPNT